ncbi:MAG: amino acid ABC transporter substrate-binding protein [Gammaproteobacteria bacterium]|nr:amino acid ABC transporter substrate-binding protein [Gammaproteobacteria bacterium]MDH3413023.1 amino acid ABC transporter substrate-binding protein [Gammaproteobacteria bacterium]
MLNRLWLFFALALLLSGSVAAQSGTLDKIRASGVITMGYVESSAPFSFVDERKQPQGYSVELCRAIASGVRAQLKLASLETRWVPLTIQNRLEAVASGRVNLECGTTTWTLSRQALVDFSLITFLDGGSILSRADSQFGRISDFSGKRLAVITGTTTEKVLRASLSKRGIDAEVVTVNNRTEGLQLLDSSKVDGFASDRTALIGIVLRSKTGHSFKLLDEDFSVEQYALALPRGDHEFRLAVNRVLARLYRTGAIQPIYNQWLGKLGPPSLLLSATYFIQGISE